MRLFWRKKTAKIFDNESGIFRQKNKRWGLSHWQGVPLKELTLYNIKYSELYFDAVYQERKYGREDINKETGEIQN